MMQSHPQQPYDNATLVATLHDGCCRVLVLLPCVLLVSFGVCNLLDDRPPQLTRSEGWLLQCSHNGQGHRMI